MPFQSKFCKQPGIQPEGCILVLMRLPHKLRSKMVPYGKKKKSNKPIEYQPLKANGNYYCNVTLLLEGYLKPQRQIILG